MPKVKINQAIGGHDKGDTIDVTPGVAKYLETVEAIEVKTTTTRKTTDKADADSK